MYRIEHTKNVLIKMSFLFFVKILNLLINKFFFFCKSIVKANNISLYVFFNYFILGRMYSFSLQILYVQNKKKKNGRNEILFYKRALKKSKAQRTKYYFMVLYMRTRK